MKWIGATEWFGDNLALLWASDGKEIFRAQYRESDLCQIPEERLFIKFTEKVWLPVVYAWTGPDKPQVLPSNVFSAVRNFNLSDLLSGRLPELDRKSALALYSQLKRKLPRLPTLNSLMEEALYFTRELPCASRTVGSGS